MDLGITGVDVVEESNVDVETLLELDFGACKLCLQAPISSQCKSPAELSGKRIVTSFPTLARRYFDRFDTPERTTSMRNSCIE